ncbi:MAG: tRNA uridine(34) 5-carboxymethylaminomethyl modification radical SAM/GNAT enzyme Elp3 [Patescibacteria group bacterium]|nr:tRNA uridine(34) 5-carboxymethylaminomethyl modification radical SAM/GNAT enzyme Elp3 [Patescibacteria group bacterium]
MPEAIKELLKSNIKSRDELTAAKRKAAKQFKIGIFLNSDILKGYKRLIKQGKIKPKPALEKILRKRTVRTLSGIAPVAVLIKPYPCPGKCVYCPSEKGVPQSYLSNEPAVMRAIRCNYDPYKQVQFRLRALEANGHEPNKIELIVIGATWSVVPEKYKYWFIGECFRAANEYNKNKKLKIKNKKLISNIKILKKELAKEQSKNEKTEYRIIGITLETRPDYISQKELWQMRELGCTRVELGAQALDDKILKLNKRGHGVAETVQATKLLKNFGFKVTYHIMPGLPGSTPSKDFLMFKQLFSDKRFQPDQIKFYPTVVTRGSLLYKWWKTKKYKPYTDKQLQNLIIKCKKIIPPYVRIIRLIRDIPQESIIAGNLITNLRQIMKDRGVKCGCIRCREAGNKQFKIKNAKLTIKKYKASGGQEYFISYESKNKKTLYGFCRLRLPNTVKTQDFASLQNSALIRELHVYGELVPVGKDKIIQHAGLGKKLMKEAEKIAKGCGFKKIIVISGIGVREYYKKLGYKLENTYMVKTL